LFKQVVEMKEKVCFGGKTMSRCRNCGGSLHWNGKKWVHVYCNFPEKLNEKEYVKLKKGFLK